MSQLKIGVVGYGNWGKNHVRVLSELNHLGGVYDELYSNANSTENIKFHNSLEELINNVDGLIISSPANTHYEIAKKALERIDVLIEKPIAMKTSDVINLQELEQKYENLILVGHQLHFHPAIIKMESLINGGEIGNLKWIYSNRLNMGKIRPNENVLWSFAPHDLSLIFKFINSDVINLSVQASKILNNKIEDTTLSLLDFENGQKAHVFVSWIHPFKEQRFVVVGDKGSIVFSDSKKTNKLELYKTTVQEDGVISSHDLEQIKYVEKEPLKEQALYFIDCIKSRKVPINNSAHALKVTKILEESSNIINKRGR
jgi:UDP-2-acetamido-3-amino-2,3-dideoxy-glucuronate N-acetyltransferase|tara:strand:- start:1906 stop:2850 length:945 start_codon:yes stop_codon:yes gene_type:complete